MKRETIIKLILIALLIGCLFNMTYGYYTIVRIAAMIGFVILAYMEFNKKGLTLTAIIMVLLAALFQPFFKVGLSKELWNVIDVIVASGLIYSIIKK